MYGGFNTIQLCNSAEVRSSLYPAILAIFQKIKSSL